MLEKKVKPTYFPEPSFPQDWAVVKSNLFAIDHRLRELLIFLVTEEQDNTLSRAEAGVDTIEEIRQELADLRVLNALLQILKGEE